ncbi:MAG: hypothetical protein CO189_05215, partial [candidate division Zixibacteria bacterium CG_4_9_14_3_um_filter_46_8]
MKNISLMLALAFLMMGATSVAFGGEIDSGLMQILDSTPPNQSVSVLVYLTGQANTDAITTQMDSQGATLKDRHETVVRALQDMAGNTQGAILNDLSALKAQGQIKSFEAFWLANCIRVDAPVSKIEEIAQR